MLLAPSMHSVAWVLCALERQAITCSIRYHTLRYPAIVMLSISIACATVRLTSTSLNSFTTVTPLTQYQSSGKMATLPGRS